ncbi:isoprenylcysteine carboxylmethyltransferase family protein [Staphylococcus massiliensis]|uniref:Isoprenylcysteine carboxyl methyltransferase n=1 Tax=Staphylococcus massiliensis S46 TaxID=1229783 RepID=K9AF95_9STAP|nr:isoprenylcysteine carboxylmethyltransferase family protein [Staphylococcus massiliensis]EKU45994.1 hypothetical protein C273_10357 [Staphylococcus massiliensis S46]MCG3399254.1 hypothetical protein [Staphylococcus massiliensis]PNZ97907.1 hypothetical protein CD133_09855 [Staphylococcus massiliensis CCUG 55927]
MITWIIVLLYVMRCFMLGVSEWHARALKQHGLEELKIETSMKLELICHIYYLCTIVMTLIVKPSYTMNVVIGLVLITIAYSLWFYIWYILHETWALRLFKVPSGMRVTDGVYKFVRHPEYFIVTPLEVLGIMFISQTYFNILIMIPYVFYMWFRIKDENAMLKESF